MSTPAAEAIRISTPQCEHGIGTVIRTLGAGGMIAGVVVRAVDVWPDDRGYFLEVARMRQGLAAEFPSDSTQVSAALSYPGTIKAFHFHQHQTDLWVPAAGMFQVALVDLRPESPTFGVKNTLYAGSLKPWQILIPPGVAAELSDAATPVMARQWIAQPPAWLRIHSLISPPDAELMAALDRGECEATQLVIERQADILIMDEWKGRAIAQSRGLPLIGALS